MVAFKTFFHVLAAGKVAKLEDVSAILQNIISVAQQETYPPETIRFLRSLATMLHPSAGHRCGRVANPRSRSIEIPNRHAGCTPARNPWRASHDGRPDADRKRLFHTLENKVE